MQPLTPDTPVVIEFNLSDIDTAAKKAWQYLAAFKCITFSGDMGAGKTTFISALCNYLKVDDAVSSPTFALINEYHYLDKETETDQVIYHMDWYRLNGVQEAINAGIEDCLYDDRAYCFVEWPEKAQELLPYPYVQIILEPAGKEMRLMQMSLIQ